MAMCNEKYPASKMSLYMVVLTIFRGSIALFIIGIIIMLAESKRVGAVMAITATILVIIAFFILCYLIDHPVAVEDGDETPAVLKDIDESDTCSIDSNNEVFVSKV